MKHINKKALYLFLKMSIFATLALASVLHIHVLGLNLSPESTLELLSASLPLSLPYANMISLICVGLFFFFD